MSHGVTEHDYKIALEKLKKMTDCAEMLWSVVANLLIPWLQVVTQRPFLLSYLTIKYESIRNTK